jgi:large subunit ribosomal protein L16
MLLAPKNNKFNRMHKPVLDGVVALQGLNLQNGNCGLKVLESGLIKAEQIEAVSKIIRKKIKKTGKLWVSIFPSISLTTKSLGVRMGKGKGKHAFWAAPVKAGRILFELRGVSVEFGREIFEAVAIRLPLKTRFVTFIN